eukprot:1150166-Pelagomonas_calceolata.AAC.5
MVLQGHAGNDVTEPLLHALLQLSCPRRQRHAFQPRPLLSLDVEFCMLINHSAAHADDRRYHKSQPYLHFCGPINQCSVKKPEVHTVQKKVAYAARRTCLAGSRATSYPSHTAHKCLEAQATQLKYTLRHYQLQHLRPYQHLRQIQLLKKCLKALLAPPPQAPYQRLKHTQLLKYA